MVTCLILTGLILLIIVYGYILRLFKEGFKLTYASFTFPLAISNVEAYKLSTYFTSIGHAKLGGVFNLLSNVEIFITIYVVFFILLNFLNMS